MYSYDFFLSDSLEKVFPLKRPVPMGEKTLPVFEGMIPAVQLVYKRHCDGTRPPFVTPIKISVLGTPVKPVFRFVELVPADFPCYEETDSDYITTEPGLFPDVLVPADDNLDYIHVKPLSGQYRSVWIDFPGITAAEAGVHKITVITEAEKEVSLHDGSIKTDPLAAGFRQELNFSFDVKRQVLPAQNLLHTQWFHTDCLSSYYKVEVLSEAHWKLIEAFIQPMFKRYGINTLLTPVFTPPLDTEPGMERPAVQLVDIIKNGNTYTFNFDKLKRWCALCKKHGITHIELPHFFTQWGARWTPKIIAKENNTEKRIFGWDVSATSPEYRVFLEQFIPALRKALDENGYDKNHTIFHVSDEPAKDQREDYLKAKEIINKLTEGSLVVDALCDIEFYREGIVEHPVPATNHAAPFIDEGIPDLWVYYCSGQYYEVPNRFFAMPSVRIRAMGILLYYFDIKGFLHWGYNFYYSQNSKKTINPFLEASGIRAWPAGDPFLVYPGDNGQLLSSIRGEVHRESLEDIRLLNLLEKRIGRESVLTLIKEDFPFPLSFMHYPREPLYYSRLREKAAQLLEE